MKKVFYNLGTRSSFHLAVLISVLSSSIKFRCNPTNTLFEEAKDGLTLTYRQSSGKCIYQNEEIMNLNVFLKPLRATKFLYS